MRRIAAGNKHTVLFCLTVCFLLVLGSSQGSCKVIVTGLVVLLHLIRLDFPLWNHSLWCMEALELCVVKARWLQHCDLFHVSC